MPPYTFETSGDAEAWLVAERRQLTDGAWLPPEHRAAGVDLLAFGAYADR
jgi:hypothetical protein